MPTPSARPNQLSRNLGGEGSSKNHQFRASLLKAWSSGFSCGIDQECVRDAGLEAPPDLLIQNLHLIRILIQSLRGMGLGSVHFPLLLDPTRLQG